MAVTAHASAPYAPASAVLNIVQRHRNGRLPSPVNSEVLARAGISNSLIPRTLQALESLDLTDDAGATTPIFEGLRLAPESEYKKCLEDWLKGAYADVFAFVDPSKDDSTRIRDAFRGYQPTGQQERMVSLFQGLCAAAGLIAEKPKTPRVRLTPDNPIRSVKAFTPSKLPTKPWGLKAAVGLPPALTGLMESIPSAAEGWTKQERQKFMTTFEAVLDFCIPIIEKRPMEAAKA